MKKMLALVSLLVVGLLVGCGETPKPVVKPGNSGTDKMIEAGLSMDVPGDMEKACKMVLARDEQLWLMTMQKNDEGKAIREALCEQVYTACQ